MRGGPSLAVLTVTVISVLGQKRPLGRWVPSSPALSASVSRGSSQKFPGACGFLFKNGRFVTNLAALE